MSQPPCMRKPQGDPPKRVTSLALIPRRHPRSSSSSTRASGFSRVASRRVVAYVYGARNRVMYVCTYAAKLSRHSSPHRGSLRAARGARRLSRRGVQARLSLAAYQRPRIFTRNATAFAGPRSRRVDVVVDRQSADGDDGHQLRPLMQNADGIESAHARARERDPHSSVARVELTARPSALPHHYAPARTRAA